jgi:hypothetical protein
MAKHTYTVLTPEGAQFAGAEEASQVELDLDAKTKRAVIAAGWLEQDDVEDDAEPDDKRKGAK